MSPEKKITIKLIDTKIWRRNKYDINSQINTSNIEKKNNFVSESNKKGTLLIFSLRTQHTHRPSEDNHASFRIKYLLIYLSLSLSFVKVWRSSMVVLEYWKKNQIYFLFGLLGISLPNERDPSIFLSPSLYPSLLLYHFFAIFFLVDDDENISDYSFQLSSQI